MSVPSTQVQSDQFIPVEDIHGEMSGLEKQLDELEQRGVELEKKLRDNPNGKTGLQLLALSKCTTIVPLNRKNKSDDDSR